VNLDERLDAIVARLDELSDLLSGQHNMSSDELVRLSKEYSELKPVIAAIKTLRAAESEVGDLAEMIADQDTDGDMRALAEEEFQALKEKIPKLDGKLKILLLPKDEADEKSAILEIRAGTGGGEAALFAANLMRMYQRYSEEKKWRTDVISLSETGIGGVKEVIMEIGGRGAFARLKYESGVHRVQRVPETEASGRIHTSAATVAVLPEAQEVDLVIADKDLRVDVYRASGPGGQSVNTTDSAVRLTHLPTGIVVTQQDEKSQHKNRAKALKVMRARLYDYERQALDAERAETRRGQVGSGDRSERIRTYNFPQARVTDHRINLTLYKLDKILSGEALDEIIDELLNDEQTRRLAQTD
jgi:peptide chain release factor 1